MINGTHDCCLSSPIVGRCYPTSKTTITQPLTIDIETKCGGSNLHLAAKSKTVLVLFQVPLPLLPHQSILVSHIPTIGHTDICWLLKFLNDNKIRHVSMCDASHSWILLKLGRFPTRQAAYHSATAAFPLPWPGIPMAQPAWAMGPGLADHRKLRRQVMLTPFQRDWITG